MQDTKTYAILNVLGAGLSCYTSTILIDYMPFVILEGTRALIAFIGLIGLFKVPRKFEMRNKGHPVKSDKI